LTDQITIIYECVICGTESTIVRTRANFRKILPVYCKDCRSPKKGRCWWHETEIAKLRSLWGRGLHMEEIAAKIGRTRHAIQTKANKLRLGPRHPQLQSPELIATIRAMRKEGFSYRVISNEMNLSPSQVAGIIARHINENSKVFIARRR